MTDKTLAERLRDEMPATQSFQHSLLGDLLAEAADALDAKDAEIACLRKALIRAEGAMDNAEANGDMRDALLVVRSALWD